MMTKFLGVVAKMCGKGPKSGDFTISDLQVTGSNADPFCASATLLASNTEMTRGFDYTWELHDTTTKGTPLLGRSATRLPRLSLPLQQPLRDGHRYRLRLRAVSRTSQTETSRAMFFQHRG